jgi:hypothetical protein
MTAVLVLLLLAQPEVDDLARIEQRLVQQLDEAERVSETDRAAAVRLLDALLDDPQMPLIATPSRNQGVVSQAAKAVRNSVRLVQETATRTRRRS